MPQSLSKVLVHLIFSTKHREPLIPETICPRLHASTAGILDNLNSPSLQSGVIASIRGVNWPSAALSGHRMCGVVEFPGRCPGLMSYGAFGAIALIPTGI